MMSYPTKKEFVLYGAGGTLMVFLYLFALFFFPLIFLSHSFNESLDAGILVVTTMAHPLYLAFVFIVSGIAYPLIVKYESKIEVK